MSTETYFANLDGDELANAVLTRVRDYQKHLVNSGYWGLIVKSAQFVHGLDAKGFSSFAIRKHGPRGEYARMKMDDYASLYLSFMAELTGQRIVFEPQPKGEDWRASEQAKKAKSVLQDDLDSGLEEVLLNAVDHAAQLGMSATAVDFDPLAGQPTLPDPDGGPVLRSGKLTYRTYMPQNAAFDFEVNDPEEIRWWVLRRWEDAHDLIAMCPEREREILAARGGSSLEQEVALQDHIIGTRERGQRNRVPVYEFRHGSTPACPMGRIAWVLGGGTGTLLFAEDLPFVEEDGTRRICVRRLALRNVKDSGLGWTPIWLLLAPQELMDMLQSIEATNYKAHGVGVILNPRGSDITPKKVSTGLAVIDYVPGLKPELANFTAQPQDIAGAQERAVSAMQRLIGVSAIDRGDPPASLKSGSALLFVKATTTQGKKPYLEKVNVHHEGVATDFLLVFWLFATQARDVRVRGELGERTEPVSGEDIGGALRVKVQLGNPLTRSMAGQVQIAENLLAQQAINASEYLEIIDGAGLDKILTRSTSQRILVEQENAMLRRGENPLVSPTHDPTYHIAHHALELNSQQALANPAIRNAVLQHIHQHQQMWAQATVMNPGMLEALGIPLMQAALGMAQASAGAPPLGPGGGGSPSTPPAEEGPPDGGQMPKPPQLPPGTAAATGVNPLAPGPGGVQ